MVEEPQKGRSVGIDYGKARVGMAISDERKIIASPLSTISTGKKCEHTVTKVLEELRRLEKDGYVIAEIVVGLPLKMSGKVGDMANEAVAFARLLEEMGSYPVTTWDERLTTVQADRAMREGKLTRKKRAKSMDAISAVIILQNFLDSKQNTFFPDERP